MRFKIVYEGKLRSVATHEGNNAKIEIDAPKDNHGKGEAYSPTDLTAMSLGGCMLTVMGIYAKKWKLNIGESVAEVEKVMASEPRRIGEIKVNIYVDNPVLTEKHQAGLEHVAINCPVAKSLHPDIKQTVHFRYRLEK